MVIFSMNLRDPKLVFQGHGIFEVDGQSFYRTLIGNHTQYIEWYHFQ